MSKQFSDPGFNRGNQFSRQDDDFILKKAQAYAPVISQILDLDSATTEHIKTGVEKIEELVKSNASVKTHQIRNVFNLIRDTTTKREPTKELNKLRPKLAYIGARQSDMSGKIIVKVVDELIVKITSSKASEQAKLLDGLRYVMESIVAYHKFYSKEKD